jgi:hypothetical protein
LPIGLLVELGKKGMAKTRNLASDIIDKPFFLVLVCGLLPILDCLVEIHFFVRQAHQNLAHCGEQNLALKKKDAYHFFRPFVNTEISKVKSHKVSTICKHGD